MKDQPSPEHRRPKGVDDNTVEAMDTFIRALETMEVARGHLLQFHRLTGTGDTVARVGRADASRRSRRAG